MPYTATETVPEIEGTPVDCEAQFCIGLHDGAGDHLNRPGCDLRCRGHYGQDTDCDICPEPRCLDHSTEGDAHGDVCDFVHCEGHQWDGEDLSCIEGHAGWCEGEDTSRCFPGSCERDLSADVTLVTELVDGETTLSVDDASPTSVEKVDELLAAIKVGRDLMEQQEEEVAAIKVKIEAAFNLGRDAE
jgi:hypothetical protein